MPPAGYPLYITDYAAKLWSGLLHDYYLPRWQLFAKTMVASAQQRQPFPAQTFETEVIALEQAWINQTNSYPTVPKGSSLSISQALFNKYAPYLGL